MKFLGSRFAVGCLQIAVATGARQIWPIHKTINTAQGGGIPISLCRYLQTGGNTNALTRELQQAKAEKEKQLNTQSDMTAMKTQEMLETLGNGPEYLERFDAELFGELVEKIIIESNDSVRFVLKNELEVQESIERTVRRWGIESNPLDIECCWARSS